MKSDYCLLILGGGIMQLPAIKIAKRQGWRVIVADANPAVPGAALCDVFENVDLKDKEAMLAMARSYREQGQLDGVFTAGTDFSATVAWIAESLGLPGIPYAAALKATDKSLMRAAFKEWGVPCPGFVKLEAHDDPRAVLEGLTFPLVIKPVDSMGARAVRRIDTAAELLPAFQEALAASHSGKAIIEEFMEGPEFSLDAVVYQGEVTVCGVADRHIFFPPCFIEMGHTLPTSRTEADINLLEAVFMAGIKALGITNGAAKGDIFLTGKGAMIGEIAARLSGGYMSGWTYPYATGIEPTLAAMRIALGMPPGDLMPRFAACSAERAFLSIPGQVKSITGGEAVTRQAGIKEFFCRVGPGSRVVFPTNNVEKCGNVIACDPARARAGAAAAQAVQTVRILLTPGIRETEEFLFSPVSEYPPAAFLLEESANRAAFERMPACTGEVEQAEHLAVIPLPCPEREPGTDWHGHSLSATLQIIAEAYGRELFSAPQAHALVLGRLFWAAVFKGGYQGGIYCLQTLAEIIERKENIKPRLEAWIKGL